jgi:hypothetical protein
MVKDVISKPIYQILSELTQESRLEVALAVTVQMVTQESSQSSKKGIDSP